MGRDRLLRQILRERFLLTLRGGEAFEGLLIDADDKTVRLGAVYAVDEKSRAPVDGEMFVPRAEILYMIRAGAQA